MNRKIIIVILALSVFAVAFGAGEVPAQEEAEDPTDQNGELAEGVPGEATDIAVIGTPQEFQSYFEAEKQAIAREREALVALRSQVKQEMVELLSLQKKMEARMEEADKSREAKIKKLIKVYSSMRSDEAGNLLMRLDEELSLKVLSGMKPKLQAKILAGMTPDKAAAISKKLVRPGP